LVIQLVLFFAAGFYAVLGTFVFAHYRPLEALPSLPFVAVTGAGALAVMALGRGAPRMERLVLGVLTVAALTAAVHPALLRVNALTATPQEVSYLATGAGRFEARDAGLPALDLSNEKVDEYWAQYPLGAEHPFTLLRGAGCSINSTWHRSTHGRGRSTQHGKRAGKTRQLRADCAFLQEPGP
jgi:hypothetical protein